MAGKDTERLFKAVANKRRIAILSFLKKRKDARVGAIADAIKLSLKSTSKHLGILLAAGYVDRDQKSLEMHYRIADELSGTAKVIVAIL